MLEWHLINTAPRNAAKVLRFCGFAIKQLKGMQEILLKESVMTYCI